MKTLAKYAKALVAGLVPAVILFLASRAGGVTADEWELIFTTLLAGAGLTWAVPNAPENPAASDSK